MILKPHDRFDHGVHIANPKPLNLCRSAGLEGRKDQSPVEPLGHAVKQRDVSLDCGPVEDLWIDGPAHCDAPSSGEGLRAASLTMVCPRHVNAPVPGS